MDMELLEQEISKIEASIDEYDKVDTVVMADSIQAIEEAGYKLEAIEPYIKERAQDYIDFLPIPRIAPWN